MEFSHCSHVMKMHRFFLFGGQTILIRHLRHKLVRDKSTRRILLNFQRDQKMPAPLWYNAEYPEVMAPKMSLPTVLKCLEEEAETW